MIARRIPAALLLFLFSTSLLAATRPELRVGTNAQELVGWSEGVEYHYDSSGNVKKIGDDTFVYDTANRLIQATVNGDTTSYEYDAFGNRMRCRRHEGTPQETECQGGFQIEQKTNRLKDVQYDDRGMWRFSPGGPSSTTRST